MKRSVPTILNTVLITALGIVLLLVIWQPVIPSGLIIQGMADQLDPESLSLEQPAVLRFELAGRGGGNYNLVLSNEKVEVTEGKTDQADLIIAMMATDFNKLLFQMAQGKADEFTFSKLIISNKLKFAGDMGALELLKPTDRGE